MDAIPKNRFQRRKERTRRQLKEAAIALILEKGYENVTIDNIVEKADVGKGTFYLHFKDKESLVWDTILEGIEKVQVEADRWFRGRTDMEYYGFRVAFEYADQNRGLFQIMFGKYGYLGLTERVKQYLVKEIEQEIRARTAFRDRELPPDFAAEYVAGALTQTLVWWLETPNPYNPAQMARMFYQMTFLRVPDA